MQLTVSRLDGCFSVAYLLLVGYFRCEARVLQVEERLRVGMNFFLEIDEAQGGRSSGNDWNIFVANEDR
jgi:hypothetical protein